MTFEKDIAEIRDHINDLHESVAKMETNISWLKWIALAIFAERVVDKLF